MLSVNRFSLHNLLLLDALTCAAMGTLLVLWSEPLLALTNLSAQFLFYAGALLFPTALFMLLVGTKVFVARPAVWLVIAGNYLWVAASLLVILTGWVVPNAIGYFLIGGQALAVALLAVLEQTALRQTPWLHDAA